MNLYFPTDELSVVTEQRKLRIEIPTENTTHILYLSLMEAKHLQTQLSQGIIQIFRDRLAESKNH